MKAKKEDFITGVLEQYPDELLENRLNIEACTISCIFKDPLLIDDSDLKSKDFITRDGRYYFSLAKYLRDAGLSAFDEVAVTSHITEEMQGAWEEHGGWEQIANAAEIVDTANFNKFLDDLYKYNTILSLYKDGFNVLVEIKDGDKKYRPIDLFKREDWTSDTIVNWYESRMARIGTGYTSKVLEEDFISFEDDFLESLIEGDTAGVPFEYAGVDEVNGDPVSCFPFLSRQVSGVPESGSTAIGGYSSSGKSTFIITIIMGLLHQGRKVMIVSNEEKIKRFKVKFILWCIYKYYKYYGLTRNKINSGNLTDEDIKYLNMAKDYWNEHFSNKVKFVGIADSNMSLVKKKIREGVLRQGIDVAVYDTFKLNFDSATNNKEYLSLIEDSRTLDQLAKQYNIIMLYTIQLTMSTNNRLWIDSSCLSQSKQIVEILENLFLIRNAFQEEIDPTNKLYCHPFRLEQVDGKWVEKEFVPDPKAAWKFVFLTKCREGVNSDTNGQVLMYRFDGAHGIFTEKCFARPRHGYIQ